LLETLMASRVVARGPKASAALHVAGLPVWASPDSERLDDALDLLAGEDLDGRVVAYQHYGELDHRAAAVVERGGGTVIEVPVYRYRGPGDDRRARALVEAACHGEVDAVTFTSAPAVTMFRDVADAMGRGDELVAAANDGP